MHERTFIGLDVHARSVQAGVLDGLTGEVKSLAVPVATNALVAWVCAQPTPAVTDEAGPTGYELARAREDARGDLMRARHRLSKLLLRRGIVWEERAWTQTHELWLVRQRCASCATAATPSTPPSPWRLSQSPGRRSSRA